MILTQRIVRHNVSADGLVDFYVACNWLLMVRCLQYIDPHLLQSVSRWCCAWHALTHLTFIVDGVLKARVLRAPLTDLVYARVRPPAGCSELCAVLRLGHKVLAEGATSVHPGAPENDDRACALSHRPALTPCVTEHDTRTAITHVRGRYARPRLAVVQTKL